MSSSYCSWMLAIDKSKEPNFKVRILQKHIDSFRDQAYDDEDKVLRKILKNSISELKSAWNGDHFNGFTKVVFSTMAIIQTGGETWGDSPTELFDFIDNLHNAGLLEAMGFEY